MRTISLRSAQQPQKDRFGDKIVLKEKGRVVKRKKIFKLGFLRNEGEDESYADDENVKNPERALYLSEAQACGYTEAYQIRQEEQEELHDTSVKSKIGRRIKLQDVYEDPAVAKKLRGGGSGSGSGSSSFSFSSSSAQTASSPMSQRLSMGLPSINHKRHPETAVATWHYATIVAQGQANNTVLILPDSADESTEAFWSVIDLRRKRLIYEGETKSVKFDWEEESPTIQVASSLMAYVFTLQESAALWEPVDPVALGIPDYADFVTCPMDFGTINRKLKAGKYNNSDGEVDIAGSMKADFELVFNNAFLYNGRDSDIGDMCKKYRKRIFLQMDKKLSGLGGDDMYEYSTGGRGMYEEEEEEDDLYDGGKSDAKLINKASSIEER